MMFVYRVFDALVECEVLSCTFLFSVSMVSACYVGGCHVLGTSREHLNKMI